MNLTASSSDADLENNVALRKIPKNESNTHEARFWYASEQTASSNAHYLEDCGLGSAVYVVVTFFSETVIVGASVTNP